MNIYLKIRQKMMIKHKVLKDFQLLTIDKKIIVLKAGSVIEEYKLITKANTLEIEKDIIDNNPEFFQNIDWRQELISYMKIHKIPQPSILGKKIIPFIEEMFVIGSEKPVSGDYEREYKLKLKSLNDRELDLDKEYRSKLKSANDKELDCDIKMQKLERREFELENEINELNRKELDSNNRLSEIRSKEESIRDMEFEIGKKERNMDKDLLESEKNLDERQSEMNSKLELKLSGLDKREIEYNQKMEELLKRESAINSIDLKEIERMVVSYYNDVPWFHNGMGDFKDRIEKIIQEIRKK